MVAVVLAAVVVVLLAVVVLVAVEVKVKVMATVMGFYSSVGITLVVLDLKSSSSELLFSAIFGCQAPRLKPQRKALASKNKLEVGTLKTDGSCLVSSVQGFRTLGLRVH